MLWIVLALVAHALNALVFVVDKSLLGSGGAISRPIKYAFYSALLAGVAIVILPFTYDPLTMFVLQWSMLAGILHILALWIFFRALKAGEPSRVVPVVGSAVPIFTLLAAFIFLGESFNGSQLLAILFLIGGGALLSVKLSKVQGLSRMALMSSLASGILFAGYFATIKFVYDGSDVFLSTFVYSRVIESVLALLVIGPIVWFSSKQQAVTSKPLARREGGPNKKFIVPTVFVSNKVLAAGAFLLQSYAISLGSVTVVNALQGTQYVFLLLLAAMISVWFPKLFREEIRRVALLQKVAGVVLISTGLVFLL